MSSANTEIPNKAYSLFSGEAGLGLSQFPPRLPAPEGAADGGQEETEKPNHPNNPVNPV